MKHSQYIGYKFGTHNSVTGEKSNNLISKLIKPFAKCQKLTIEEQIEKGVRYFDLRVKRYKNLFVLCHGFWIAKPTVETIIKQIDEYAERSAVPIYVSFMIEDGKHIEQTISYIDNLINKYYNITYTNICNKKPTWHVIRVIDYAYTVTCHKILDGSTWHTYIPIPYLWNKVFKFEYNKFAINLVDFYE